MNTVFNPGTITLIVVLYFVMLIVVSYFTASKSDSNSRFFNAGKSAPWYLIAIGMIGASLSGVTFISVPGWVGNSQFSYMQVVLGYFVGYIVIAYVLLPIYYRMNLISIYQYLENRFGNYSYKTGAFFFIVSRLLGASFRLFLVANVFQIFIFEPLGIPFAVSVFCSLGAILLYTFKGGIQTIIYTDVLQTVFMLASLVICIFIIQSEMNFSFFEMIQRVGESRYSQAFFWDDWKSDNFFWKQFLGGMFIAIAMTGLDQDMMQKNLACRNIKDAQKNMMSFSAVLIGVNFVFLFFGALLFMYASQIQFPMPKNTDDLFPLMAVEGKLGLVGGITFILGLTAAAYSSADSALTALTTSVCIDLLDIRKYDEQKQIRQRKITHIAVTAASFFVILLFGLFNNQNIIKSILQIAGYTYGPLLGMFFFGIFTKRNINDKLMIFVALVSPVITWLADYQSKIWLQGYKFGFELLLFNGLITFIGMWLISNKNINKAL